MCMAATSEASSLLLQVSKYNIKLKETPSDNRTIKLLCDVSQAHVTNLLDFPGFLTLDWAAVFATYLTDTSWADFRYVAKGKWSMGGKDVGVESRQEVDVS